MSVGIAPWVVSLLVLGQASPAQTDKDLDVPKAFSKKIPESVQELKEIEAHVRLLAKNVMPAVVGIRIGASSGSGVIIDAEGHVLTAGHVSGDPNRNCELILPNGRKVKGRTLGANHSIDSGMIKILDKGPFPFVEMAKSADLDRGDWCLAIGHPGGFQTGRSPVVRLGRLLDVTPKYLRSDCTLVGGDSGGPLFDMKGRVIGIHSRIGGAITANIHVPVDTYRDTFDRLVAAEVWGSRLFGGNASDAYLGIQMDPESKECKIQSVLAKSPAEKAGLKADDMIVKFDGRDIASRDEFLKLLQRKAPGNTVSLDVLRGEERLQLRVVLGKRPAS